MNDVLRDRLIRKLDSLPEDRVYQIFDYIDFLESKYSQRTSQSGNPLTRFAEGMEDTMRAGRVSANVIGGTMNIMSKAVGAINDVAQAGKSVASGIIGVATGGSASPDEPTPHPSAPPRGGPHELGSQLPQTGEQDK
ncbi:MAG TPA: hypothetical protein VIF83_12555 [Gemmatimonadaceae bacterium]